MSKLEAMYRLSPMQRGMLFHSLYSPDSGIYVEQIRCTLTGQLDEGRFAEALSKVLERHPILRTAFVWKGVEEPVQVVRRQVPSPLEVEDWRHLEPGERDAALERLVRRERQRGFQLTAAPLLRLVLARTGDEEYQVVLSNHHLLLDGWSRSLVLGEVFEIYHQLVRGRHVALPAARPFQSYVTWLERQDPGAAEAFWSQFLAGYSTSVELDFGGPRREPEAEEVESLLHRELLDADTTARLGDLARSHDLTLNSLIQAAWALLLAHHAGVRDVVYGVTVSGRTPELEGIDSMVGLFINTLPMRARPVPDLSLLDWLRSFQADLTEVRQYEYSSLAQIQNWSEIASGQSLFDSVVVFENYPVTMSSNGEGPKVSNLENYGSTNYPIVLVIEPDKQLVLALLVHEHRFSESACHLLLGQLRTLLQGFVEGLERPLADHTPLSPAEREQVLGHWNETSREIPPGTSMVSLFDRHIEERPEAVAVLFGAVSLSYGELARRRNGLAHRLCALGVERGDRVGLCLERSPEMVVSLLAILEVGAAYLPLDPAYPAARLSFMLEDAAPSVVIGSTETLAALPAEALEGDDRQTMVVGAGDEPLAERPEGPRPGPEDLAYVSYTSGSTGRPKGVEIPHRAVVRLVCGPGWMDLAPGRTFLQLSPVAFDASTLELWGPLLNGGRCALLPGRVPSVEELHRVLGHQRVDSLWLTVSLYNALIDQAPEALLGVEQLVIGGEALSVHHIARGLEHLPRTTLLNGYGPTENTTFTCTHRLPQRLEEGTRSIPIGRPLTNSRVFVLDDGLFPVGIGAVGELWAAGDGLAQGYFGRPGLSAERFVPDAFSGVPGGRLYRTGDRVRWTPEGVVEFLGRGDQQLKIRGFRIEPGEIETVLLGHPAVREAAVWVREDAVAGKRLLAWVVAGDGPEPAPGPQDLRAFLADQLPEYMVPGAFVFLEELPRTANGKLDRGRLPDPRPERAFVEADFRAPRSPEEELLAQVWSQVLGGHTVGIDDDFFELGGHSLLATQLVSRVNKVFGVDLGLRTLFEAPTIAELARHLREAEEAAPPLESVPSGESIPLSFAQKRLWFIDQLVLRRRQSYNIFVALGLEGALQIPAVGAALGEISRRHQVLRTTFPTVEGLPRLKVHEAEAPPLPLVDLSALPTGPRDQEVRRRTARAIARPFDLAAGPLLRVQLLRLGPGEHIALVGMHHIVSDGWSMGIFVRELGALYGAYVAGRPSPLPEPVLQYGDYARWQRNWLQGEVLERQLDYWRDQLLGTRPLDLPTDRPRPAVPSYRGGRRPWQPSVRFSRGLEALARRRGVTLFMVLATGFEILLARLTGQRDLAIGAPVANRNREETEGLIGCFVNTLVLRSQLDEHVSFDQALRQMRDIALGAYTHQDIPFEKLVEELQPERDLSRSPIFQVVLVLQNTPAADLTLEGLHLYAVEAEAGTAKFDLTLTVQPSEEGLTGSMEYSADLFDPQTVDHFLVRLERLLTAAVEDPRRSPWELPVLSESEREQLLHGFNDPSVSLAVAETLHGRFARQAAERPDTVALTFDGRSLTYGELRDRSRRLAGRLVTSGVHPGEPVGLCLERSAEMVVGVLGVLESGGAYLPLDHTQPSERLRHLVEDSGIRRVVTTAALAEERPELPQALLLEAEESVEGEEAQLPVVGPGDLAYIIYTSGSTGKPKGVGVSHGNALRLMLATEKWFDFKPRDSWTLFHSYAFDFSVWELWGPLLYGGRLVVVPYWVSRTPESFWELLVDERVTVLNQTPSAFRQLIPTARAGGDSTSLRRVIFGGEALELESLRPWFEHFGDRQPRLINMYGITETTVHVTYRPIGLEDVERSAGRSVIGVPIPDLQLYVLDRRGNLVPPGVAGELCVGGAGLAQGYLARGALTASRFVPHAWSPRSGERLYRSGDLGRWLKSGEVEYLGRIDHQVKVRGFRIELGEIEAVLQRHEAVQEVVAMVLPSPSGDSRLVAWVGCGEAKPPEVEELRTFAGRFLTDYMVPAVFVVLETLPLTPNGKIDRALLLSRGVEGKAGEASYTAPRSAAEHVLATIWSEVLGVERVGVHDNFFTLGGDSILSIQVRSRARLKGLEFSLPQLFEHQTIARLVTALDAEGPEAVQDEPLPEGPFALLSEADRERLPEGVVDAYPLVRMQSGMLFHSDYSQEATAYHDLLSCHLRAPFDAQALTFALEELLAAHPVLRTSFELTAFDEPLQLVHGQIPLPLVIEDLRSLNGDEQERYLEKHLAEERQRRMPWDRPPLLAVWFHRRGEDRFQLTFSFHHAILDGWSLATALTELFQRYLARLGRGPAVPPPPGLTFRDFVALERRALASSESRAYWESLLYRAVPLELPRLGGEEASERVPRLRVELLHEELSQGILRLARSLGVPVKSVLLAAHLFTLHKLAGRRDILTGMVSHGRSEESEGERVLGLFLNTLPFRFRFEPGNWQELILAVFRHERQLLSHRRVPLAEITQWAGGKVLFDTAFNFVHFHVYRGMADSPEMELLEGSFSEETHFRLAASFGLDLGGEQLQLRLEYDGRDFDEEGLGTLYGFYEESLVAMVSEPDANYELLAPAPEDEAPMDAAPSAPVGRPFVEPRTEAEKILAGIWQEVLEADRVGLEDNFFELGGDSILSLQVVARSRQAGLRITPKEVFESGSLGALAEGAQPLEPAADGASAKEETLEAVPLVPIQRWFFERELPTPDHWNQSLLLKVERPLDPELLRRTLAGVMRHHRALESRFLPAEAGEEPRWTLAEPGEESPFEVHELGDLEGEQQRGTLEHLAAEAQRRLDLAEGPLVRMLLFRLGGGQADRLLLTAHHLVIDGVSWRILLEDLEVALKQLEAGGEIELPEVSTSYRVWAKRLAVHAGSEQVRQEFDFWCRRGTGERPLPLGVGVNTAGSAERVEVRLERETTEALLREVPRAWRTGIDDALLSVLARVLCRHTGGSAVRVDLESHGREESFADLDLSRTIGWLTAIYPVVLEPGSGDSETALKRIKEQLREVPGGGLGHGLLRYRGDLESRTALAELPQAQVSYNYLGQLDQALARDSAFSAAPEFAGATQSPEVERPYALEVLAQVVGGCLEVSWVYGRELQERSVIEALATDFLTTLRELVGALRNRTCSGATPSDFPLATRAANLGQKALEELLASLPEEVEDLYPLSPMQEGLLFESLLDPESDAYFEQFTYQVEGALDPELFHQAWRRVVARHPVLRTAFRWQGLDRPLQAVLRRVDLDWHFEDWSDLDQTQQEEHLTEHLEADRVRGFDLAVAPVMRWLLVRRGEERWTVVWSHHHLLLDGWCLSLLTEDVFQVYRALLNDDAPQLTRRRPYREYIAWLESQDPEAMEAFWPGYLEAIDHPTPLPSDRAGAPGPRRSEVTSLRLSAPLTATLQAMARDRRWTLGTLLHGVWGLLLARTSGESAVVFGSVVSGRPAELEGAASMIGLFINTLPVVVCTESERPAAEWFAGLQEELAALRQVEHTPLSRARGWSGLNSAVPLFESLLAFENYQRSPTVAQEQLGARVVGSELVESTGFPLTLAVGPSDELLLQLEYDGRRFDRTTVQRMLGHLHNLLTALPQELDASLADLPLLGAAEKAQLFSEWNDTQDRLEDQIPVHGLVARRVAEAPEAPAVLGQGVAWTYGELWERVEHLAGRLAERGLGPETLVGLAFESSPSLAVALLAVLRAGAAYLPLDPAHPSARLVDTVRDAGVRWVLTARGLEAIPATEGVERLFLEEELAAPPASVELPSAEERIHSSNLAYVVYTSGSTGRPKGVETPHGALAHYALDMVRRWGLGPEDRVLQFAPVGFDVLAEEVLTTWISGGSVVFTGEEKSDITRLGALIESRGVSWIELPAAFWHEWVDHLERTGERPPAELRLVLLGCDRPSPERVRFWSRFDIPLMVVFGLTETTITNTLQPWRPGDDPELPIGFPVSDTRLHVLDRAGHPLPMGALGELWIGGAGIARGYRGAPSRTAARFLPDPFSPTSGERLYRTGDRARWRRNGSLEFLGRLDLQAKVRGFRVEPGEVEAALLAHPDVRETVVLIQELDVDRRLVAWVLGTPAPDVNTLRAHLAERLPEYMVPALFLFPDHLPLTANGKVNRRALLEGLPQETLGEDESLLPLGPVEQGLAGLWSDLLGVSRIGRRDDFFRLGGHSLLATRLVSWVRHVFEVELPLRQVFENPTLGDLAQKIEDLSRTGGGEVLPPLEPSAERRGLPLSFAQERLWVLQQLEPGNPFYNMPGSVRIQGDLDPRAMEASLAAIASRHEVLRTGFVEVDGRAALEIHPQLDLVVPLVDLSGLEEAERREVASRLATAEALRPFDLRRPPLLRAVLLRLEEEEHAVLLTLHHIVGDAWSIGVLIAELGQLYDAFLAGRKIRLPELAVQYADYAHWQRAWLTEEVLEGQLAFWRERLIGLPPSLELPTDRPRPEIQSFRGGEIVHQLEGDLSQTVARIGRERGATLFMVLLAAFGLLLGRLSNQVAFTVGTPVANRGRRELEGLIGFFLNTLVLPVDLRGNLSFETLLDQIRRTALSAYAHQDLPFERLVEELRPRRDPSRSPLFQVMFVLQNAPVGTLELEGATLSPLEGEHRTAKFDLTLSLEETPEGLLTVLEYATDLYDVTTAEALLNRFGHLLQEVVEEPSRPLAELSLFGASERRQLLEQWNPVLPSESFDAGTLTDRFAARLGERPEAIAVLWPGETASDDVRGHHLSYAGLYSKAHVLARQLRDLGVGPGESVGLACERSVELVIGILAVLEAGAAYVPLDIAQPAQRLGLILEDAAPRVILTTSTAASELALPEDCFQLFLDREPVEALGEPAGSAPPVDGSHPAYIIYTSGSTGRPKGVVVRHANAVRLFDCTQGIYGFDAEQTWTLFHSYAFDFSVWEIWGALLYGGRLVVVPYWVSREPEALLGRLVNERVTVLNQTPSAFRQLLAADSGEIASGALSLQQVIFGGEALDPASLTPWFERGGAARLVNMYGITETTVHVTWRVMEEADARNGSRSIIGRAIPDLATYVVDRWGALAPVGVPGELCIGGAGLAAGYLGRGGITASRFVPDALGHRPGARLYRSGDLGRYLPSGELEYLGRIDDQVKVRGFRIELGEIEAALGELEAVREATVGTRPALSGEGHRLVSWIVPMEGHDPSAETLREALLLALPDYMVPSAFVTLEAMPLTVNGKLDRRALPEPEESQAPEGEAPRTPAEKILAEVWQDVLRVDSVGRRDNFFVLGGDSILGIQLVSRARRAGLELSPKQLFQHQTLAELAAVVVEISAQAEPEEVVVGEVPLLPVQRWFLAQEPVRPDFYNQAVLLAVDEPPRLDALGEAVRTLLTHHDMLRALFEPIDGSWRQRVAVVEEVPDALVHCDLSHLEEDARADALEKTLAALQRSLRLDRGPLLRLGWIDLGTGRPGRLFLVAHHLVIDGVSWRILLEDLEQAYGDLLAGNPPDLPPRTTSYRRWAQELEALASGPALAAEKERWLAEAAVPVEPLPRDLGDGDGSNPVSRSARVAGWLEEEETQKLLQEVPKAYRTRIDDVLMTALAEALAGWTGGSAVRVALEGHGREEVFERQDLSRTVGWFTSIYPVLLEVLPEAEPGENLRTVKETLRSLPRKGLGYGVLRWLVEDLGTVLEPVGGLEVSFNYLGQLDQALAGESLFRGAPESVGEVQDPRQERPFLLEVDASVAGGRLHFAVTYGRGVHREETLQAFLDQFATRLRGLIDHCTTPGVGGFTPSDFPLADCDQEALDRLVSDQVESAGPEILEDIYPLSPMQQGMLIHALYAPNKLEYFNQLSTKICGPLDVEAFRESWRRLAQRHPIFRTAFAWDGLERPHQVVHREPEPPWVVEDWRSFSSEEQAEKQRVLLAEDTEMGIDLGRAPVMRFHLIRLKDEMRLLVWSHHHMLVDGWSIPILFQDLFTLYQALAEGAEPNLEPARPYRDYINWLAQQDHIAAEAFWRSYLAGFTEPTPLGIDQPAAVDHGEVVYGSHHLLLAKDATQELDTFCRRRQLTINTLVQASWALLLSRFSGSEDVVFGTVVSGRPGELPGIEGMIGPFINSLPARVQIRPEEGLMDWLMDIQKHQIEMRTYEFSSLMQIQEWSSLRRDGRGLFESAVAFENYPVDVTVDERDSGIYLAEGEYIDWNSYPISLAVAPGPELSILVKYSQARLDAAAAEDIAESFEVLLRTFPESESYRVKDLIHRLDEARNKARAAREARYESSMRSKLKGLKRRPRRGRGKERVTEAKTTVPQEES